MTIMKQATDGGFIYYVGHIFGFLVDASNDEQMSKMIRKELPITQTLSINYILR